MMETAVTFFGTIVLVLCMAIVIALFISLPVMWLWDAVMPDMFGLKEITWTQALWLSLLCSLLFKSSSSKSKD
jgi:hypothetical protein